MKGRRTHSHSKPTARLCQRCRKELPPFLLSFSFTACFLCLWHLRQKHFTVQLNNTLAHIEKVWPAITKHPSNVLSFCKQKYIASKMLKILTFYQYKIECYKLKRYSQIVMQGRWCSTDSVVQWGGVWRTKWQCSYAISLEYNCSSSSFVGQLIIFPNDDILHFNISMCSSGECTQIHHSITFIAKTLTWAEKLKNLLFVLWNWKYFAKWHRLKFISFIFRRFPWPDCLGPLCEGGSPDKFLSLYLKLKRDWRTTSEFLSSVIYQVLWGKIGSKDIRCWKLKKKT